MTISVNPATRIITVPLADLTLVTAASGSFGAVYSYNVDAYRLELRDWEDSLDGMGAPPTHNHNTEVTLAGVTYARVFEQVNGYTTTFELDTPAQQVSLFGANHNIGDVQNVNGVGLIINNSAGLQTVVSGSGVTQQDKDDIEDQIFTRLVETGFTFEAIMRVLAAAAAGKINQDVSGVYQIRDINDTKDRIEGDDAANGGRDITAIDAT